MQRWPLQKGPDKGKLIWVLLDLRKPFPHSHILTHFLTCSAYPLLTIEEMQILLLVQPHLRNNKQFRQMIEYMHSVWSRSLGGWGNRNECVLVKTKTTQYFLIVRTSLFLDQNSCEMSCSDSPNWACKGNTSWNTVTEPPEKDPQIPV